MSGETTWRLVPLRLDETTRERIRKGPYGEFDVGKQDLSELGYYRGLTFAPKPPAGLYAVSEDGTARRVEVDVVGALRGAFDAVNSAYAQAYAEWQDHGRTAEKHSVRVDAWRNTARAALRALTGEER